MTGVAWLSSARVVRCMVKSSNERNPYSYLPALRVGTIRRPPCITRRKAGRRQVIMALTGWATHVLQWEIQMVAKARAGANPKKSSSVRIGVCNSTP